MFALVSAEPTGVDLAGQIREIATRRQRDPQRHDYGPPRARDR